MLSKSASVASAASSSQEMRACAEVDASVGTSVGKQPWVHATRPGRTRTGRRSGSRSCRCCGQAARPEAWRLSAGRTRPPRRQAEGLARRARRPGSRWPPARRRRLRPREGRRQLAPRWRPALSLAPRRSWVEVPRPAAARDTPPRGRRTCTSGPRRDRGGPGWRDACGHPTEPGCQRPRTRESARRVPTRPMLGLALAPLAVRGPPGPRSTRTP